MKFAGPTDQCYHCYDRARGICLQYAAGPNESDQIRKRQSHHLRMLVTQTRTWCAICVTALAAREWACGIWKRHDDRARSRMATREWEMAPLVMRDHSLSALSHPRHAHLPRVRMFYTIKGCAQSEYA